MMYDHNYTASFGFPVGDTYMIMSPMVGVAYMFCVVPVGTQPNGASWTAVAMPGSAELLAGGTGLVTSFRYAALNAEIVPTMNEMNWVGNIQVTKIPMRAVVPSTPNSTAGVAANVELTGFHDLADSFTDSKCYSAPYNHGAYAVATNVQPDFPFTTVVASGSSGTSRYYQTDSDAGTIDFGVLTTFAYRGVGEMDAIMFKVSNTSAVVQSSLLKVWACVEYTTNPSSILHGFSRTSAPYDQVALNLYAKIAEKLPIAVPYYENTGFWDRVLKLINSVGSSLSIMPGPLGIGGNAMRAFSS